jgi:hypothetical protein
MGHSRAANAPEKNTEIFSILQSHKKLSARQLQNNPETSIYINAEMGKTEGGNVFEEFDHPRKVSGCRFQDFRDARNDYGKPGKPRTTLANPESKKRQMDRQVLPARSAGGTSDGLKMNYALIKL